jgi:prefoldin subunit 5
MFSRKKTVDEVVKTLTKAQADLLALSKSLATDADAKRREASRIVAKANEAQAEADRALRVAERVSALVA